MFQAILQRKEMLAPVSKQCKSNTSVYYFINKKTRELFIKIVYANNVYFMSLKYFPLLLELKQNFITKWNCCDLRKIKKFIRIYISYNYKDQKIL